MKDNTNPGKDPYGPIDGQNKDIRCTGCGEIFKEHELRFEKRGNLYRWWCKYRNCYAANIGGGNGDMEYVED